MTTFQRFVRTPGTKYGLSYQNQDIVFPTPARTKPVSACHAQQSTRIAPRPGPKCPAGLHVPEHFVFCRKVLSLYEEKSWQKYEILTYIKQNNKFRLLWSVDVVAFQ